MANDAGNIVVAATGKVSVAPLGTTLPTDATTALDAAFNELGYIDENGVQFSPSLTVQDVPAWQSLSPVRTLLTQYDIEASFTAMEWIEDVLVLAFGGGVFTDNLDNTFDFQFPAPGERPQQIMVIDGLDEAEEYRIVLEKTELINTGDIPFFRGGAAGFPITVKALAGAGGRAGSIYWDTN